MASLVRICALTAALFVALSFALFAADEMGEGSKKQVEAVQGGADRTPARAKINEVSPAPAVERLREAHHSSVREILDDGNDLLVGAFSGLIDSNEIWVQRMVPGLIGLLLYGFGGLLLANALPQPATRTGGDWRQPAA